MRASANFADASILMRKIGFLLSFCGGSLRPAATGVPRGIRCVQAHPGGLDEAVASEINRGHRPPPAGAGSHPAPGQGRGTVMDFPFPAASGKIKLVLTGRALAGTKCPKAGRGKVKWYVE